MAFAEDETGVTEIRAGVYAFFDLFMANLGVAPIDRIAGSVLATVIGHQKAKGQVIVDAGFLAMSRDRSTQRQPTDYGFGLVCDVNGKPIEGGRVIMKGTNQEHGILEAMTGEPLKAEDFPIGMRVRVLPNHACPTAAPYRTMLLLDKEGRILRHWPVEMRDAGRLTLPRTVVAVAADGKTVSMRRVETPESPLTYSIMRNNLYTLGDKNSSQAYGEDTPLRLADEDVLVMDVNPEWRAFDAVIFN